MESSMDMDGDENFMEDLLRNDVHFDDSDLDEHETNENLDNPESQKVKEPDVRSVDAGKADSLSPNKPSFSKNNNRENISRNNTSTPKNDFKKRNNRRDTPQGRKPKLTGQFQRSKTQINSSAYSYQQEILDSYLMYPIAAHKLHETVVKSNLAVSEIKKGICLEWAQTGSCNNENCCWSHEPSQLFATRLRLKTNLEIINFILSMKDEDMYIEALQAGFEELIERNVPDKWIRFLVFYVFAKTECLYFKFLGFWSGIAKYFCMRNGYDIDLGYVELVALLANVQSDDRYKVFKFLEMINAPPLEVKVTYLILKPILHFDLPPKLLIEAVKSCNERRMDYAVVQKEIIPKINIDYISLDGLEVLLTFLEITPSVAFAKSLKSSLKSKILSLRFEINENEFPRTAKSFQQFSGMNKNEDEWAYEELMNHIKYQLTTTFDFKDFTLKINEINEKFIPKASEEIMKAIFSLDLPQKDIVALIQTTLYSATTKSAKDIAASVARTLIYLALKEKNWTFANEILSSCDEKNISLSYAKIVGLDPPPEVDEVSLVFMLADAYLNNGKLEEFILYFDRLNLFSNSNYLCTIPLGKEGVRTKLKCIDNCFKIAFAKDLTTVAFSLFIRIVKSQLSPTWPIDMREYLNDMLVALANQRNKEAFALLKLFTQTPLKPITVRSLLIFMVQENLLESAKTLFTENARTVYKMPKSFQPEPDSIAKLIIESTWSEEELCLIFNYYFDKLMRQRFSFSSIKTVSPDKVKLKIFVRETSVENDLEVKPYLVMDIPNSETLIKERIQNVLEKKIAPPVKSTSLSNTIIVDHESFFQFLKTLFLRSKSKIV